MSTQVQKAGTNPVLSVRRRNDGFSSRMSAKVVVGTYVVTVRFSTMLWTGETDLSMSWEELPKSANAAIVDAPAPASPALPDVNPQIDPRLLPLRRLEAGKEVTR